MTSSAVSSPTPRYSPTARWLHWLSASLIVWATLSGLAVSLFLKETGIAHVIADFNVSATLVFIPFFIWRIAHRLRQGVPDYDATLTETNQRAALGVHYVLYGLTAVVLLSGVLMMNRPFSIFYLIEPSPLLLLRLLRISYNPQWQIKKPIENNELNNQGAFEYDFFRCQSNNQPERHHPV